MKPFVIKHGASAAWKMACSVGDAEENLGGVTVQGGAVVYIGNREEEDRENKEL